MKILVLNAGSSSQKSFLYELGDSLPELAPKPLWEAQIDWTIFPGSAELRLKISDGSEIKEQTTVESRSAAIKHMLERLWSGPAQAIGSPAEIDVVGHRVVHGGHSYQEAILVTPEVRAEIERLAVFAPLHNRADLEGMECVDQIVGPVRQIAVFDTAFQPFARSRVRLSWPL